MQRFVVKLQAINQKQKCLEIKSKSSLMKKRTVKTWTQLEDQRLITLYNQFPKKWNLIAEKMNNRNENQCLHRFRRICQSGQNKKIWSLEEDYTVLYMIAQIGHNWKLIAQTLGTKNGKQIRERYINRLDPKIRREEWTKEQDLKIIELYSQLGSKWCKISQNLPGRPENRIKNRFYSFIQKNYQFEIKQKTLELDQKLENKQNGFGKLLIKNQNKKQIKLMSNNLFLKRPNITNFFQDDFSFSNKQQVQVVRKSSEICIKEEVYDSSQSEIEKQIKQAKIEHEYQSMKQINEECFFNYSRNENSKDFLYFGDA